MDEMNMMNRSRSVLSRASSRGLTLVELMIVMTILGILGGAIFFGVYQSAARAQVKTAELACGNYRKAVLSYRMENPEAECPTPEKLQTEKHIGKETSTKDPWGKSYKIVCGEEVTVISFGPNGKEGDEDDIRVPKAGK